MRTGLVSLGLVLLALGLSACRTRAVPAVPAPAPAPTSIAVPLAVATMSEPGPRTIPWAEPELGHGGLQRCATVPPVAFESECVPRPRWAFEADAGLYSRYVWRGILVTDDPVLQGSVTATKGDFSFNAWANVDLTDYNATEYQLNEIDLTPDYTRRIASGRVSLDLSVGAIGYLFPATPTPDALEVYLTLAADVLLAPRISVWRELIDIDSTYVAFAAGHSFDLGCWELDVDAALGWGDRAWHRALNGVDTSALNDLTLTAAAVFGRGRWQLIPKVSYSTLLDGDVRAAVEQPDLWAAALVLAVSF